MSEVMSRIEANKIIKEYGRISLSYREPTVIPSVTEYPTIAGALKAPITASVNILALPFTQWESVNPKVKPVPDDISVATIHVRLLQGKAWMDGKVKNTVENTGDVDFMNSLQDKVDFKETKSSKRLKYVKSAKKSIGNLNEGKKSQWEISWKVDGIWKIFKALISILRTGKLRTTYTCHFEADYTVNGTAFFIIPQTKTETYSKNFSVNADVAIRRFKRIAIELNGNLTDISVKLENKWSRIRWI